MGVKKPRKAEKSRWNKLKLKSGVSFGHINHDSELSVGIHLNAKEGEAVMQVTHCDSMLLFDRKQAEQLRQFLEKHL